MNRARISAIVLVAVAFGFALGTRVRESNSPAESPAPIASAQQAAAAPSLPAAPTTPQDNRAARPSAPDGKDFLRALPSLQAQARAGNLAAMRLLYQRLGSCTMFQARSDEQIIADENARWQRQIDIEREITAAYPARPRQPPFDEASLLAARDQAIEEARVHRDLCTGMSERERETRIEWLQLLLDRHDRVSVLDAAAPATVNVRDVERVRNAERLVQLASSEREALDALIAGGDIDAITAGMNAYRDGEGLLERDAERAYAYAHALSLAGAQLDETKRQQAAWTIRRLTQSRPGFPALGAEQIEKARAAGLALYQRCCAAH